MAKSCQIFSQKISIEHVWLGSRYASELQYVVCISNPNIKLVRFDVSFEAISHYTCMRLTFYQHFRSTTYQECISGRKLNYHYFPFLFEYREIYLWTSLAGQSNDDIFQILIIALNSGNENESIDCNWICGRWLLLFFLIISNFFFMLEW